MIYILSTAGLYGASFEACSDARYCTLYLVADETSPNKNLSSHSSSNAAVLSSVTQPPQISRTPATPGADGVEIDDPLETDSSETPPLSDKSDSGSEPLTHADDNSVTSRPNSLSPRRNRRLISGSSIG